MTRFYEDLNPGYPAKGERRWCVFKRWQTDLHRGMCRADQRSFTARKSAKRHACELQVEHSFAELGIVVVEKEPSKSITGEKPSSS